MAATEGAASAATAGRAPAATTATHAGTTAAPVRRRQRRLPQRDERLRLHRRDRPLRQDEGGRKRTALGRFAHESASFSKPVAGQPLAVYMGDDARGEYIYKFVSSGRWTPPTPRRPTAWPPATSTWTAASCTWPVSTPTARPVDRAVDGNNPALPATPPTPLPTADVLVNPPGGRRRGRHAHGPPRVVRRATRQRRGLLHAHQQQQPPRPDRVADGAGRRQPACLHDIKGTRRSAGATSTATSCA
jgi:hypothetical protein